MKKRFISFGSIEQFRNVIRDISHAARYIGIDDNDEPVYDKNVKLPTLMCTASEKIHGANAAVCYNNKIGFWVQSRKNIITIENDNAGCAKAVEENEKIWMELITDLANEYNINLDESIVSVFFEWCGGNIQKNSAVTGLDKRAIIFQHFKVSPLVADDMESDKWIETRIENQWIKNGDANIFNIMNFLIYQFEINFEHPLLSQNEMLETVKRLERKSEVGSYFGKPENIGEGLVLTVYYRDKLHRFKVKGEKHSKTKVKTLKIIDEGKEKTKIEFANYACSADRLEQAWQSVFGIEYEKQEPSIKAIGDFLRCVFQDIMKEESDILTRKNLTMKDVNKQIAKISKSWFMTQLDNYFIYDSKMKESIDPLKQALIK